MFKLAIEIARSITIDKPLPQVHQTLSNFKSWRHWSPWICMDKQTQLDFFGEDGASGSGYRWSSRWIGEGELQLQSLSEDSLEMRLDFFTPWRSTAGVFFKLAGIGENCTEVTWILHGSLPILLFFMKSTMRAYIGRDYQRGLLMLKDYLETGNVLSDTEVCGIVDMPDADYIGVRRACALDNIGPDMKGACADLTSGFKATGLEQISAPFTLLHDWNMKTGRCEYTFAFPVAPNQNSIDVPNLIHATRPSVKALKLQHTGEYKHLGNAWSTGYSRIQNNKKMKLNKKQSSFEIYVSDPANTPVKDLLTEIYIPVQ
jgi:effector-binding domain-containing protein